MLSTAQLTHLYTNFSLSGGGTVTVKVVNNVIRVRWDALIRALPFMGKATFGSYDISCPASGTIGTGQTIDADGMSLGTNSNNFAGLYYIVPIAATGAIGFATVVGNFRIITFSNTIENVEPHWVLLAVINTDTNQALVKWQAGNVVLPLPDNGQQIQWGSNVQQLGRGASKLSLDGATCNANIPGALTVGTGTGVLTVGAPGTSGHVVGVSVDHSIILRGDTTTANMNYMITPGDACCFIEYGGRWVFRRINPGLNENLFEINTTNVFYKSIALQRIPYVSCRISGNTTVSSSRGQIVPTVSSSQAGGRTVTLSPPHPAGASMNPHVTLISNWGYIYVDPPINGATLQVGTQSTGGTPTNLDFYLLIL